MKYDHMMILPPDSLPHHLQLAKIYHKQKCKLQLIIRDNINEFDSHPTCAHIVDWIVCIKSCPRTSNPLNKSRLRLYWLETNRFDCSNGKALMGTTIRPLIIQEFKLFNKWNRNKTDEQVVAVVVIVFLTQSKRKCMRNSESTVITGSS